MSERVDLEAARKTVDYLGTIRQYNSADQVQALIAEVERLRERDQQRLIDVVEADHDALSAINQRDAAVALLERWQPHGAKVLPALADDTDAYLAAHRGGRQGDGT